MSIRVFGKENYFESNVMKARMYSIYSFGRGKQQRTWWKHQRNVKIQIYEFEELKKTYCTI